MMLIVSQFLEKKLAKQNWDQKVYLIMLIFRSSQIRFPHFFARGVQLQIQMVNTQSHSCAFQWDLMKLAEIGVAGHLKAPFYIEWVQISMEPWLL